MNIFLTRKKPRLYHYNADGMRIGGPEPEMRGDHSDLRGDHSDLRGDCYTLPPDIRSTVGCNVPMPAPPRDHTGVALACAVTVLIFTVAVLVCAVTSTP